VRELAPFVLVPKTSVDEDYLLAAGEGHIGPTRRSLPLNTKSVTELVEQATDEAFGLGIHPPYTAHVSTALS
jgi:hypothetical protein